jgi:DNA (cytosine-5)-methyltransferase 1
MKYGSVCTGIAAPEYAWSQLGWDCVFQAEIDKFPSAVLEHHYKGVPNHGDFTQIEADTDCAGRRADVIDLLVGGTPCQSFSVAGLRAGLDDPRGNLALEFLALVERLRPRWVVWENVPGVLSSIADDAPDQVPPDDSVEVGPGAEVLVEEEYECEETHAFACFLAGLQELGYGSHYRSLDAQYFGVAQRRKRVFVVAYLGDWRYPSAVLLERACLRGDSAPSRQAGEDVAGTLAGSSGKRGSGPDEQYVANTLGGGAGDRGPAGDTDRMTFVPGVANPLTHRMHKGVNTTCDEGQTMIAETTHTLKGEGHDASEDGTGRGVPIIPEAYQCHGSDVGQAVAFQETESGTRESDHAGTLRSNGPGHDPVGTRVRDGMTVRRLLPEECELLMGFPRGYTKIPYNKKPAEKCADGPRYKALGNSIVTTVMLWLGRRIQFVEELIAKTGKKKRKAK